MIVRECLDGNYVTLLEEEYKEALLQYYKAKRGVINFDLNVVKYQPKEDGGVTFFVEGEKG